MTITPMLTRDIMLDNDWGEAGIRQLYLKSVLRQDMTFFDVGMTTGQVVSSISADMILIQGAIGEKVSR